MHCVYVVEKLCTSQHEPRGALPLSSKPNPFGAEQKPDFNEQIPILSSSNSSLNMAKHLKTALDKLKTNDPDVGLPGREDKIAELETFLIERLKVRKTTAEKKARVEAGLVADLKDRHNNKTVFICGVPGTGKTAVVMKVVEKLQKKRLPNITLHLFRYAYINAQHVSSPEKVYSSILKELTDIQLTPERAQDELDKMFLHGLLPSVPKKRSKADKEDMFNIVIIDELDLLYSDRRQNVFYSLFDWPTSHESRLILITIANAMDLPERFMRGRIGSRLGWNKIIFEPYTSDHLESILKAKLGQDLMSKCFDRNAILVASKRIGKTTGDARRIIDTCCLALEEAVNSKSTKVTSALVDRVGFQNLDLMKSNYVRTCPPIELIILKSILNETANHGEENVTTDGVYRQVSNLLRLCREKHAWFADYCMGYEEYHGHLAILQVVGLINLETNKMLLEKKVVIKDSSEIFRDVIRNTEITI